MLDRHGGQFGQGVGPDDQRQAGAQDEADLQDVERRRQLRTREEVGQHGIAAGPVDGGAAAHEHPHDEQLPEALGQAAQGGHHRADADAGGQHIFAGRGVDEQREWNADDHEEQRWRQARQQADHLIGQVEVRLDVPDQEADHPLVELAEHQHQGEDADRVPGDAGLGPGLTRRGAGPRCFEIADCGRLHAHGRFPPLCPPRPCRPSVRPPPGDGARLCRTVSRAALIFHSPDVQVCAEMAA